MSALEEMFGNVFANLYNLNTHLGDSVNMLAPNRADEWYLSARENLFVWASVRGISSFVLQLQIYRCRIHFTWNVYMYTNYTYNIYIINNISNFSWLHRKYYMYSYIRLAICFHMGQGIMHYPVSKPVCFASRVVGAGPQAHTSTCVCSLYRCSMAEAVSIL